MGVNLVKKSHFLNNIDTFLMEIFLTNCGRHSKRADARPRFVGTGLKDINEVKLIIIMLVFGYDDRIWR